MLNWFFLAAVIVGLVFLLLQSIAIYLAVQRTPLEPGVSLAQGLRRSMAALGPAGRRWAAHPWRMTALYICAWLLGSVVLGIRMAFYAR